MTPADESSTNRATRIIRSRRRRTGTAAAAFSHALSITGSDEKAQKIAVSALRRGAGSRSGSLAHARHLTAEASSEPTVIDRPADRDLRSLAQQLSESRPTLERQIVDLELRYGLDHGTFSRVLGISAADARKRSRSVAEEWAANLDPAMMASLGPGSCEGLASILADAAIGPMRGLVPGPQDLPSTGTGGPTPETNAAHFAATPTVAQLLALAPVIREHAVNCDICEQRLKLMTPVRTLVGQQSPSEVPPAVSNAARHARRRIPAPLPRSVDAKRIDPRRLQSVAVFVASVSVVVAVGYAGATSLFSNEETQEDRVRRLIQAAPSSSILATPSVMTSDGSVASLANNSSAVVTWEASTTQSWLAVEPRSGRLEPSQTVSLAITADNAGDAAINITASDGSRQTIRFQN